MSVITDMWTLFQKGGLVMYPLLFCSIVVLAIAVERLAYYRGVIGFAPGLLSDLDAKLQGRDWEGATVLCAQSRGVIAAVLTKGLRCKADPTAMKNSFESAAALESANLRKNLGYLETIVTLAPLLGLLGTVIGMIGTFNVFDNKQSNTSVITGGVGEALVATATGLCVAVLALVVHSYFSNRLDAVITDMEEVCAFVLERVKGDCP